MTATLTLHFATDTIVHPEPIDEFAAILVVLSAAGAFDPSGVAEPFDATLTFDDGRVYHFDFDSWGFTPIA